MEECNYYNNWCEKEKRTCKNCYYENTKDKEEIKTMVEDIEEALQEKFPKLKFIVKFVKIKKTYEIKVGNINIFYSWDDTLTFERNIEYIIIYLKLLGGIK